MKTIAVVTRDEAELHFALVEKALNEINRHVHGIRRIDRKRVDEIIEIAAATQKVANEMKTFLVSDMFIAGAVRGAFLIQNLILKGQQLNMLY